MPSAGPGHLQAIGQLTTAFLVALVGAAHTHASAQTLTPTSVAAPSSVVTVLVISMDSIYDSNAAQASPTLAAKEHLVQGEEILSPNGSLTLSREIGAESAFLQAAGGYDFHSRNHILNREHVNVAGGGTVTLSSCQVAPTIGYSRQETELQDLAAPFLRNETAIQSYQAAFSCSRTVGFSPTATASYLTDANGSEIASNFRVYTANAGLAYDQPVLGRLVAFDQYQNVAFTNRVELINNAPQQDGYTLNSTGLRFIHSTGGRLTIETQAAYTTVDNNIPGEASYQGPTYQSQINYAFSTRLSLSGSVDKSIQPSNFPGVSFVNDTEGQLSSTYTLVNGGDATVGGEIDNRAYEGHNPLYPSYITRERRDIVFVNTSWQFTRRLELNLDTRYERRTADPSIYTWSGVRTSLMLSATFE